MFFFELQISLNYINCSTESDDEKTLDRELYLAKARHELFEVMHYCLTLYECRFQLVSRYHAWPNDPIPPECNSCDNCIRRREDNVMRVDAKLEILEMLEIVTVLCENNDKQITPVDVVEVFGCSTGARLRNRELNSLELVNHPKPQILHTKPLAKLALANLVCRGHVKQTIWLERKANKTYLTSSMLIEGVTENANSLAENETWSYWTKKNKKIS